MKAEAGIQGQRLEPGTQDMWDVLRVQNTQKATCCQKAPQGIAGSPSPCCGRGCGGGGRKRLRRGMSSLRTGIQRLLLVRKESKSTLAIKSGNIQNDKLPWFQVGQLPWCTATTKANSLQRKIFQSQQLGISASEVQPNRSSQLKLEKVIEPIKKQGERPYYRNNRKITLKSPKDLRCLNYQHGI